MSKKNKKKFGKSDVEISSSKNVLPQQVFILSKAQGFEVDGPDSLISKVTVVSAKAKLSSDKEYFTLDMKGYVPKVLFKDDVTCSDIEKGRFYLAVEMDIDCFREELAATALLKGQAIAVISDDDVRPYEIVEVQNGSD